MAADATPEPQGSSEDWRSKAGFYQATGKCCICGGTHRIGLEPRFMYQVCEEHSLLSPVEVGQRTKNNLGI